MSTPCFDAMDDPDDERRAVLGALQYWGQVINPDEWRGDVHASAEWEAVEPLCGPEYHLLKRVLTLEPASLRTEILRHVPYERRWHA